MEAQFISILTLELHFDLTSESVNPCLAHVHDALAVKIITYLLLCGEMVKTLFSELWCMPTDNTWINSKGEFARGLGLKSIP